MPSKRCIAVIYDSRRTCARNVAAGVAAYLQESRFSRDYMVEIEDNGSASRRLGDLRSWKGSGIIADFDDPAIARAVIQSRLPTVAYGGHGSILEGLTLPYLMPDNQAVARLAADHLLLRGFRHFAYCGYARTQLNGWSRSRESAFVHYTIERGGSCAVFHAHAHCESSAAQQQRLGAWLRNLPRPCGLMAANDVLGRQVLEACRAHDLPVPHDIAVIGVDNDELQCLLSRPPMSSVDQGARTLGYAAMTLLDQMLRGRKRPERQFVIGPTGVITRQSTDVLAIADVNVAKAMAFIKEHACRHIKVPDVVAATAISRSGLERRFASSLGCSIHTAIRRTQLDRTRTLAVETELPLKQVAAETGFRSVQHMTALFVRVFGTTPASYRRLHGHTGSLVSTMSTSVVVPVFASTARPEERGGGGSLSAA